MAHPHKHQAKSGQELAKHRYANGGSVPSEEAKPAAEEAPAKEK
jgi:hypothetical protein